MIHVSFVGCGGMAASLPGRISRSGLGARGQLYRCGARLPRKRRRRRFRGRRRRPTFRAAMSGEIDAVIISTPNHLHRPQAVAAIEGGQACPAAEAGGADAGRCGGDRGGGGEIHTYGRAST